MAIIVQISDLHFGADHFFDPKDPDSLQSVLVRDLRELDVRPDCVVVSGDFTTQGDPNGLRRPRASSRSWPRDCLLTRLDSCSYPVTTR